MKILFYIDNYEKPNNLEHWYLKHTNDIVIVMNNSSYC